ncbi:hypothetical protein AKJ16_DCAP23333, partial [Drosera capensis]
MGEDLLTSLSIENSHPSRLLSMDSGVVSHDELEREINRNVILSLPPDINLPLSGSPPRPSSWAQEVCDLLDVGLGTQVYETEEMVVPLPKNGQRKYAKRLDRKYEKSKCKIVRDGNGMSGFGKGNLQLESFLVQHDMENMYMWVFKERPENALGKMQLRSYMNGHSRQGERPFPFSVEKGFVRSHKMQRKHYRGLSNPQCLHGIAIVRQPNLGALDDEEQKRWVELTGRKLNFSVPPEASEFCSWRNLPNTEFELERPIAPVRITPQIQPKKLPNGASLNLSTQPSNLLGGGIDLSMSNKKRKDIGTEEDGYSVANEHCDRIQRFTVMDFHHCEPHWSTEFSGVMSNIYGPVTCAKSIYEDDEGYLIVISLPFADPEKVKVSWWNAPTHGILKVSAVSTACVPFIQRDNRTFKLTDPSPEHCPLGDFKREIPLVTRIPDDAKLEAHFDKAGTILEILVPKHRVGPEEHEPRDRDNLASPRRARFKFCYNLGVFNSIAISIWYPSTAVADYVLSLIPTPYHPVRRGFSIDLEENKVLTQREGSSKLKADSWFDITCDMSWNKAVFLTLDTDSNVSCHSSQ